MMWFKITNKSVTLQIYVKPNATKTALLEVTQGYLNIAIHAQLRDGKANKELIIFIAQLFKIPKTQVNLIRGKESRHKLISLPLTDTLRQFIDSHSTFI